MERAAKKPALLLTLGLLSVGLAACGSDSSSDDKASTGQPVKKEASLFTKDVQLTVFNKTPDAVKVELCAYPLPTSGCEVSWVEAKGSKTATGEKVTGAVRFVEVSRAHGYEEFTSQVPFTANNPSSGRPFFTVGSGDEWRLSEPDSQDTTVAATGRTVDGKPHNHLFIMHRGDDTDQKVMDLTVAS